MLADLYLCASPVDGASFQQRLEAASAGGYAGIGLRPSHYQAARAQGWTDTNLRRMLEERGLEVVEIGFLAGWWETGELAARSRAYEEQLYRLKESLGGRHMMLIGGPLREPVGLVAERFAAVCDRALDHGLLVGLEFLPWTDTADAGRAWQIAKAACRPNGGVVLDTWHHFRGSADNDLIRAIPAGRVVAIQFSDGERQRVGTDLEDTFKRRRLPGEGDFDLQSFLATVTSMGVTAPIGVEVLSDELRQLGPQESARRAADATRQVLAAQASRPNPAFTCSRAAHGP
jgi:sugar phosphate isomerase/epimerase